MTNKPYYINKAYKHMPLNQKVIKVFSDFKKELNKVTLLNDNEFERLKEMGDYNFPIFLNDMCELSFYLDFDDLWSMQIKELIEISFKFGLNCYIGANFCDYVKPPENGITRVIFSFANQDDLDLGVTYKVK